MSEQAVHLCLVDTPEGQKQYFTILPLDVVFSKGLIPEAIVGVLLRPLASGESITPEAFARNSIFVKFLHDVIAKYAPQEPGCRQEAKRAGAGWIYVIDRRTKTPKGSVPSEDILGGMQIKDGEVVAGSYTANPNHMILSENGFFKLSPALHEHLLRELNARMP